MDYWNDYPPLHRAVLAALGHKPPQEGESLDSLAAAFAAFGGTIIRGKMPTPEQDRIDVARRAS